MYGIWKENNYYADANSTPHDDWVRDDYGAVVVFETIEKAQRAAEQLSDLQFAGGRYYLRHGEYASPDFEVLDLNADVEERADE